MKVPNGFFNLCTSLWLISSQMKGQELADGM